MYKYIFAFVIYLFIVIYYLLFQYDTKVAVYEKNLENSVKRSFGGAINSLQLLNDSYNNQNESKMASIVKDANGASVEVRDKVRYRLRKEFTSLYNDRKLSNLATFHVFDKNGNSLLRFHRLDKYDDLIINKRASLQRMKDTFLCASGFEVGLYATAYRFQYPLFYDGEFVGSYEFGIEFNAIDKEMQKIFGVKNVLFIHSKEIDAISKQKDAKATYKEIIIEKQKFYTIKTKMNSKVFVRFKKVINKKDIIKNISHHKSGFIRFSDNNVDYIAITTPVDDINNKHIGFILTGVVDNVSSMMFRTFIEETLFAILLGILIVFLIYEELEYKKYVRNIIDTQHDMLIVTDGIKIKDANQAFLDFFGVKNLEDFTRNNDCVCDHFLKEDGCLQKIMNSKSWIEYMKENPNDENIVLLHDKNRNNVYLMVNIEGFSKSTDFIIIFQDVTIKLQEKKELEDKAYYDTLTKIYARDRFNYYLDEKLKQRREFSLIMFDIDHFKDVNDTYGHDVGDYILIELTKLISTHIRDEDIFARWGGEEFMIIVNTDIINAKQFAEKLRKTVDEYRFDNVKNLTCSFGVVKYERLDKFDSIVKRVDKTLYSAKNSGRNCVVVDNKI